MALEDVSDFLVRQVGLLLPIALAAVLFYSVIRDPSFPGVPGPSFWENLPGGSIAAVIRHPTKFLRQLLKFNARYGDTFIVNALGTKRVVTSNPDDIVHVLTAAADFPRSWLSIAIFNLTMPGSLFTLPAEPHRRARARLRKHFNHAILHGFHAPVQSAVTELLAELDGYVRNAPGDVSHVLDINEILTTVTFRVMLNVAFGAELSRDVRRRFAQSLEKCISEMLTESVGYKFRQVLAPFGIRHRLMRYKREIDELMHAVVEKRANEPEDAKRSRETDLLDSIMALEGDDTTTVVAHCFAFAFAGSHTINVTLSWCLYYTCLHPHVLRKIHDELDAVAPDAGKRLQFEDIEKLPYLTKVWKEALRLNPPAPVIPREAARKVVLRGSGVTVPKGCAVLLVTAANHRSRKYWDEPERFVPERWERGEADAVQAGVYAPFGLGPRNCVGQFMADYEGVLILAELLRKFRFSLGCKPEEIDWISAWVHSGRYSSKKDGKYDKGILMRVAYH